MNRVVIAIDLGTPDQNNAISVYTRAKGWHVWHWIENVWLVSGVPDEVTPRTIWDDIMALPGLPGVKGVVFRVDDEPLYWGGHSPECWDWMKRFWGQADLGIGSPGVGTSVGTLAGSKP